MRALLIVLLPLAIPAAVQQPGGIPHVHHLDSAGSLSVHVEQNSASTIVLNSAYNGWRFEDVWLPK